jgi:hypothetical protein
MMVVEIEVTVEKTNDDHDANAVFGKREDWKRTLKNATFFFIRLIQSKMAFLGGNFLACIFDMNIKYRNDELALCLNVEKEYLMFEVEGCIRGLLTFASEALSKA